MTDTKGKKNDYEKTLLNLQVELVKMLEWVIKTGNKVAQEEVELPKRVQQKNTDRPPRSIYNYVPEIL